jgi:hypothetical protein
MTRFGTLPRWLIALILVLPIATVVAWYGLAALSDARTRLATLERMRETGSRPASRLMLSGAFTDRDRATAAARFGRKLSETAAAHRLLVERSEGEPIDPAHPALLSARIALSGSEADIIGFARSLEAGTPAIRFATWHIGRTAPGEAALRFEGRPIALWEPVP